MAVIAKTTSRLPGDSQSWITTWTGLATGDTGAPVELWDSTDKSVQITGTFGGATVTWEGTNDGTNWFTLSDPQGNAISKTTASLEAVLEAVRYMRPAVTGGAGVSINVTLFAKGQRY